jgi:tyrosyl-tRNA synthetase
MTSNYEFYQYLFNQPDDALKSLFLRFTMLSQEEINTILEQHIKEPFKHYGQKVFADTVTKDIRGESGLKEALEMTEAIFSGNLKNLNNKQFEMLINSSKYVLKLNNEINIIDALLNSNIVNSKSDAKRLIEQKSISVEDQLITDTNFVIKNNKEYTYIKKGKRDFIFIKFNK